LIIRNPLYCIPRHTGITRFDEVLIQKKYMRSIEGFHQYPGPKKVIYYQDLIQKDRCISTMGGLCDFLEIGRGNLDSLEKDFHIHKARCKMLYEYVRGDKVKKVALKDPQVWLEFFESHDLFEEYLSGHICST